MSSDICVLDDLSFFTDPFSAFTDTAFDILRENSPILQNPEDETNSSGQIAPVLISNSPPSHQLQNLSITSEPIFQNHLNFETHFSDFSGLEVKTEESQNLLQSAYAYHSFEPHSYGGAENVAEFMRRSYNNNPIDAKSSCLFQPRVECVAGNRNPENQNMSSHEPSLLTGQMRRVCSTGDLHVRKWQGGQRWCSSPLGGESGSLLEEASCKMGRYSAEERKERIRRYRAKRNLRNFNKTIKYACRKTLADSRPRIRGRFARNDETVDTLKASTFNSYEEEDDLWVDGYNEEEGTRRGRSTFNISGPTQFQYYGFS